MGREGKTWQPVQCQLINLEDIMELFKSSLGNYSSNNWFRQKLSMS